MAQQFQIAAVINPAAGGDGERIVAAMKRAVTSGLETFTTTAPGDAMNIAYKLAVNDDPPGIIAGVGGDGTMAEIATGLYRANTSGIETVPALLAAPAGTGNSVYRGLWDDAAWEGAVRQALTGEGVTRTVDLAVIEPSHHISLLGSGTGLFAATLLAARNRPEKGRDLLMAAAVAAMEDYVPYLGRVRVDGKVLYEGGIVETITGGFRYRGGLLRLVPESILDDGLLDITIVTAATDMNAFAQAAIGGHIQEVPGIIIGRGKSVNIERLDGEPILYEHDGELMPQKTQAYEMKVLPAGLAVVTTPDELPWFGAR